MWPVTVVQSGGVPVTLAPGGTPCTHMMSGGTPVTLCQNATPVAFINSSFAPKNAEALLMTETNGFAVDFTDGSCVVRDSVTGANNFSGLFGTKLTVTGTLTANAQNGAYFDGSNHATLALSALPGAIVTTACTVFAEFMVSALLGATQVIVCLDSGGTQNRVRGIITAAAAITLDTRSGAAAQSSHAVGAVVASRIGRAAIAATLNNVNASADGFVGTLDTAATYPASMTTLRLGMESGGNPLTGYLRRVAVFARRFTDAELRAYTS